MQTTIHNSNPPYRHPERSEAESKTPRVSAIEHPGQLEGLARERNNRVDGVPFS